MKCCNRRPLGILVLLCITMLIGVRDVAAQSLIDQLETALVQVATGIAIPAAISPLVAAATSADNLAVAGLEIYAGQKRTKLELEMGLGQGSSARKKRGVIKKQQKAIDALLGDLNKIKRARKRKKKKKGHRWDPFFAVFKPTGPLNIPGTTTFTLVTDGGEEDQATISLVGDEISYMEVLSGSFTMNLSPAGNRNTLQVDVTNFEYTYSAFDVDGRSTGINHGYMLPGRETRGEVDLSTGSFDFWFEGAVTNDLYDQNNPILFFSHALGYFAPSDGETLVIADGPVLIPFLPRQAVQGEPEWAAATQLSFDARSGTVTINDHITGEQPPRIALIRYSDGSYASVDHSDPALGARLEIAPLRVQSQGRQAQGQMQFQFADAAVTLRAGQQVLLQGTLQGIELDAESGEFYGDLVVERVNARSSKLMAEIQAKGGVIEIELAGGPGTFDLMAMTQGFTVSATVPFQDLTYGTADGTDNNEAPRRR